MLSWVNSDVPLRDALWMGALKAGSRMRWMEMYTAEEAHVDPAALLIIRTEQDVRAMLPLVRLLIPRYFWLPSVRNVGWSAKHALWYCCVVDGYIGQRRSELAAAIFSLLQKSGKKQK